MVIRPSFFPKKHGQLQVSYPGGDVEKVGHRLHCGADAQLRRGHGDLWVHHAEGDGEGDGNAVVFFSRFRSSTRNNLFIINLKGGDKVIALLDGFQQMCTQCFGDVSDIDHGHDHLPFCIPRGPSDD